MLVERCGLHVPIYSMLDLCCAHPYIYILRVIVMMIVSVAWDRVRPPRTRLIKWVCLATSLCVGRHMQLFLEQT